MVTQIYINFFIIILTLNSLLVSFNLSAKNFNFLNNIEYEETLLKTELNGNKIKSNIEPKIHFEKLPNFKINPKILNIGDIQTYKALLKKNNIPENLKKIFVRFNLLNFFNSSIDRLSFQKIAYIIPNSIPQDFTERKLINKKHIESTNLNTKFISYTEGHLTIEKIIPVFKNVKVEFKLSEFIPTKLITPNRYLGVLRLISTSKLFKTTDPILKDAFTINKYYVLNNSGTLVVTYSFGSVNYKTCNFAKRLILEALPQSIIDGQFKNETIYVVKTNRQKFPKLKTQF